MWLGSVILKEKVSLHSGFKFRYTTELRYLKEWHLNFTYGSLLPVQRESVGSQLASLCFVSGSSLAILSTHMQLTLKLSYIRKKKRKKSIQATWEEKEVFLLPCAQGRRLEVNRHVGGQQVCVGKVNMFGCV